MQNMTDFKNRNIYDQVDIVTGKGRIVAPIYKSKNRSNQLQANIAKMYHV